MSFTNFCDKFKSLTPDVYNIIHNKGTELAGTGLFNLSDEYGTYICRGCGLALFRSEHKFIASCGWPSFDDEISGSIKRTADQDGCRVEILCNRCDGHLGHVFYGEQYTKNNLRHCVNSASIEFVSCDLVADTQEIIFAGGCFWGVEYFMHRQQGVLITQVGYTSGNIDYPKYDQVCNGTTNHIEAIRVVFNAEVLSFEELTKLFLEIHDPYQVGGQGPDIGTQYVSAIFYYTMQQKLVAESLLKQLEYGNGPVATIIRPVSTFWPAEEYHQKYYNKSKQQPYCHAYLKYFPTL